MSAAKKENYDEVLKNQKNYLSTNFRNNLFHKNSCLKQYVKMPLTFPLDISKEHKIQVHY